MSFTESSVVLENSSNDGEILAQIELSNAVVAEACTYTSTIKRIDIKLKKASEDLNWLGLEAGSGSSASAIPAAQA